MAVEKEKGQHEKGKVVARKTGTKTVKARQIIKIKENDMEDSKRNVGK
jgi:hypothetical protein